MGSTPTAVVRRTLREYLARGVFGAFEERRRDGKAEFRFVWLLDRPFRLVCDERTATVRFRDLLAGVPARSPLYLDLKRLVADRMDGDWPRHRLVDRNRAEARVVNRRGRVSLVVQVKRNQYAYGIRKLLNLANEIFIRLQDAHQEYLWEHFHLPQE